MVCKTGTMLAAVGVFLFCVSRAIFCSLQRPQAQGIPSQIGLDGPDRILDWSLPLTLGVITVLDWGTICSAQGFHTQRYVYPLGYRIRRRWTDYLVYTQKCDYECSIEAGGHGPMFRIVHPRDPDHPVQHFSANGAWSVCRSREGEG